LGGTALPSGRYGVRSRFRPSDPDSQIREGTELLSGKQFRAWHESAAYEPYSRHIPRYILGTSSLRL